MWNSDTPIFRKTCSTMFVCSINEYSWFLWNRGRGRGYTGMDRIFPSWFEKLPNWCSIAEHLRARSCSYLVAWLRAISPESERLLQWWRSIHFQCRPGSSDAFEPCQFFWKEVGRGVIQEQGHHDYFNRKKKFRQFSSAIAYHSITDGS